MRHGRTVNERSPDDADAAGNSCANGPHVNRRRLLRRLADGDVQNVRFPNMVSLVEGFGFRLQRRNGSHHVFAHEGVVELVNLQAVDGEAKPYQVRQFLKLVERYNLRLEDEQ